MPDRGSNILVRIGGDNTELTRAVRQSRSELVGLDGAMRATGRSGNQLASVLGRGGLAAAVGYLGAKAFTTADNVNTLNRRIMSISDSSQEGERNVAELNRVVAETGMAMKEVVKGFEGLKFMQSDIGATNDELLKFNETVLKLGVLSMATADDMHNGMRQMNQALAGGIVRAEEYNSIVENMPEVMRTYARQTQQSMGEVRQEMLAGKLTAESFFNAINSAADETAERFEEMPKSAVKEFQILMTVIGQAIAKFDEALQGTQTVAAGMKLLSESIGDALNPKEEDVLTDKLEQMRSESSAAADEIERLTEEMLAFSDRGRLSTMVMTGENINNWLNQIGTLEDRMKELQMAIFDTEMQLADATGVFDNHASSMAELSGMNQRVIDSMKSITEETEKWRMKAIKDSGERELAELNKSFDDQIEAYKKTYAERVTLLPKLIAQVEAARQVAIAELMESRKDEDEDPFNLESRYRKSAQYYAETIGNREMMAHIAEQKDFMKAWLISRALQDVNDEYDAREKEIRRLFGRESDLLVELEKERASAVMAVKAQEQAAAMSMTLGFFSDLNKITTKEGKQQFEIQKGLSLAGAIVDGYKSATAAYAAGMATGGPFAPAVAAAYAGASLAATGAQIRAISSTSYDTKSPQNPTTGGASPQAPQLQQNVNIQLEGDSFTSGQVSSLIQSINNEIENGATINLSASTGL